MQEAISHNVGNMGVGVCFSDTIKDDFACLLEAAFHIPRVLTAECQTREIAGELVWKIQQYSSFHQKR